MNDLRTGCRRHAVYLGLACLFVGAAPAAHAQQPCPGNVVTSVAKRAGVAPKGRGGAAIAAACKVWPHDRRTLLSAVVFDTGNAEQKTLAVAMVDAGSGRVERSYETAVVVDSAVDFGERSLSIDTAPYELARGVRAFGLRFTSAAGGPGCADGISRDELTLFVPDGTTLRPVLQGLAMTRMDIVVTAQVRRMTNAGGSDGKPKTERTTLRYDGDEYRGAGRPPWWLSFPASLH